MARIGAKLCQNAFRTIPDVSFFDVKKQVSLKFFDELWCWSQNLEHVFFVLEKINILSVTIKFSAKNDPICPEVQVSTFLGEGVEGQLEFFFLDLGPKLTSSFCSMDHMMISYFDGMMTW